jgi:hypothetical protein
LASALSFELDGLASPATLPNVIPEAEDEEDDDVKVPGDSDTRAIIEKLRMPYWGPGVEKTDMRFLQEQTDEVVHSKEGRSVHERLARIWEQLGFTIQQKLDMAVKYSGTVEECKRFADAVAIWEKAYSSVQIYEKAYQELKNLIRIGESSSNKLAIIERYRAPYVAAETSLIEVVNSLKMQLNDEFVVKRKRAMDLIQLRRVKVQGLIDSCT